MAALPVTIVGQDGNGNPITIIGMISITGYGVGGGPIIPPSNPPGIWGGGNVPMPTPPIANVPGLPPMGPNYPPGSGGSPPGIWGPPGPWPSPPIAFPPGWIGGIPPGGWPPGGGDGGNKPPPVDWQIAWSPDTGWIVVGVPQFPHPAPSAAKPKP